MRAKNPEPLLRQMVLAATAVQGCGLARAFGGRVVRTMGLEPPLAPNCRRVANLAQSPTLKAVTLDTWNPSTTWTICGSNVRCRRILWRRTGEISPSLRPIWRPRGRGATGYRPGSVSGWLGTISPVGPRAAQPGAPLVERRGWLRFLLKRAP